MSKLKHIKKIVPGRYVVAVSGGIDSMVLLDLLQTRDDLDLVVAHLDHGMRVDSAADADHVLHYGAENELDVEIGRIELGPEASEDEARQKRYAFLEDIKEEYDAEAIITAHHRDDLLETAIINMLRGSGPRGLISLRSRPTIIRPLLHLHKSELLQHAQENDVPWREDSTNHNQKYLRNYVRHSIIPKMSEQVIEGIYEAIDSQSKVQPELDKTMMAIFDLITEDGAIVRTRFIQLPHSVANELMSHHLRQLQGVNVNRKSVDRATNFVKTGLVGKRHTLSKDWDFVSTPTHVKSVSPNF